MAKILGTKKSEDVILLKAKKDREVKKRVEQEDTFEIVDSSGKVKTESMVEKIKEEEEKPSISLHDRELHVSTAKKIVLPRMHDKSVHGSQ